MLQESKRAGVYQRQVTGYDAFVPNPLPPDPALRIDSEMQSLLSRADRALGRLDGATSVLPNPDLFVTMYVRKEAVLSSQIEGTQASLTDILELEAKILRPDAPADGREVINYVEAMNHGLSRLDTLPVSMRLVREIHSILMQGTRGKDKSPGELRRTQNWIGPAGCTLKDATFVPPAPDDMHRALTDLERFLHSADPMPLLIKVGLAHAQFETIHPFLDGNGRTGRLLITLLLCEQGVLARPLLYVSHYFKQNRSEYYDCLQSVRENGEWEDWLKFFLRGVAIVADDATEVGRKIILLREEQRAAIQQRASRSVSSMLEAYESLFSVPYVSVRDVQQRLHCNYPAANSVVKQLVSMGILRSAVDRQRNRVFVHFRYLELFDDSD